MYLYIRQRFSIGDKYNVTDSSGQLIFYVKSRLISPFYHKKYLRDTADNNIMIIRRKVWDIMPNYIIKDADGEKLARVKKKFALAKKFKIIGYGGDEYTIEGDFFAWNFIIYKDGAPVGSVNKKLFHMADQYELRIDDPNQAAFFTACVIAIDNLCHNGHRSGNR